MFHHKPSFVWHKRWLIIKYCIWSSIPFVDLFCWSEATCMSGCLGFHVNYTYIIYAIDQSIDHHTFKTIMQTRWYLGPGVPCSTRERPDQIARILILPQQLLSQVLWATAQYCARFEEVDVESRIWCWICRICWNTCSCWSDSCVLWIAGLWCFTVMTHPALRFRAAAAKPGWELQAASLWSKQHKWLEVQETNIAHHVFNLLQQFPKQHGPSKHWDWCMQRRGRSAGRVALSPGRGRVK